MPSIEARLEKLEQVKRTGSAPMHSDAARANRAIWMMKTKAPGWERVADLLGVAAKRAVAKDGQ